MSDFTWGMIWGWVIYAVTNWAFVIWKDRKDERERMRKDREKLWDHPG